MNHLQSFNQLNVLSADLSRTSAFRYSLLFAVVYWFFGLCGSFSSDTAVP